MEAGKMGEKLKMVDVSEYNPMSEDYRTGKLATTILYYTLMGLKLGEKQLIWDINEILKRARGASWAATSLDVRVG